MNITEKLDQLSEYQSQVDALNLQYQAQREALIPPEVREALAELDVEHEAQSAVAAMLITELTAEVKAEVLAGEKTETGAHLQAVYSKGASRWDMGALNKYAADHMDLLRFKKDGEPTVSFRAVK
jgi:hypothetical protein